MSVKSDFVVGWIDTGVHDFLASLGKPAKDMAFAFITGVDSSFDMSSLLSLSRHFQPIQQHCTLRHGGIYLPTQLLVAQDRIDRLFTGFDELWLLAEPPVAPKPKELVITGPYRVSDAVLRLASVWMRQNKCALALGDGTGLNYIAKVSGIAKTIIQAINVSYAAPFAAAT